ncbi:MAG: DUF7009 family protein [Bacteroidota bacterium]
MKLRIKGNSIRIRVSKTEVANFEKNGELKESTFFGTNHFHYCLKRSNDTSTVAADYINNCITVYIPETIATEWTATDMVGFNYKMPIGENEQLFLLVEKDFVCLDNTFEDQSDNYPNPNAMC